MARMGTNEDILYKSEVFEIVGAAMAVHSHFGPGFLEAVYEEALALELKDRNIPFAPYDRLGRTQTPVFYVIPRLRALS